MKEETFFNPFICLCLSLFYGFPPGITDYVWYWDKNKWILYKRNKHDISAFGDIKGYNKYISAIPKNMFTYKKVEENA